MTPGNKTRPHTMLYILTGLFGGIVIGFGTALLLQNRSITDVVPMLQGRQDSLETSGTRVGRDGFRNNGFASDSLNQTPGNDMAGTDAYPGTDSMAMANSDDTLLVYPGEGPDLVRRDEFVAMKRVRVTGTGDGTVQKPSGVASSDSLLTTLTSVKPSEGNFSEYILEFWRNPLNYKGYKIVKDRIVLFGLPHDQSYQLSWSEGRLILQTRTQDYLLRPTSELQPLIPRK